MSTNKAKVTCAGFIMCAMTPVAVMVATFKLRGNWKPRHGAGRERARYVFLTFDERSFLDRMADDLKRSIPNPNCPGLLNDHHGPAAIRSTAFDVETGASLDNTDPFDRRGEYWTNAEPLWINVDAYRPLVESIHQAWLSNNPSVSSRAITMDRIFGGPVDPSAHGPEAPSWLAWTAIRKLNMAAEAK